METHTARKEEKERGRVRGGRSKVNERRRWSMRNKQTDEERKKSKNHIKTNKRVCCLRKQIGIRGGSFSEYVQLGELSKQFFFSPTNTRPTNIHTHLYFVCDHCISFCFNFLCGVMRMSRLFLFAEGNAATVLSSIRHSHS